MLATIGLLAIRVLLLEKLHSDDRFTRVPPPTKPK